MTSAASRVHLNAAPWAGNPVGVDTWAGRAHPGAAADTTGLCRPGT